MKTNYTKGICFLYCVLIFGIQLFSQTTPVTELTSNSKTISVTIEDEDEKEPIPFANVVVYNLSGVQLTVSTTNLEGVANFILTALDDYIFKAVYVGYLAEVDTLSCNLARCNRTHTMSLKSPDPSTYIISCCACYCYSAESEEEVYEAERVYERMTEEVDILVDINDFVCFPNPAKDLLYIRINGQKVNELRVMDANGATVIQKKVNAENLQFEFNLNQLAQGIYYVVTYGEGHASSTKTIIKN